jgi:2-iminobutanoate/2-iminopropanoate deaminase
MSSHSSSITHSTTVHLISEVVNAPKALGPYSVATVAGGFAFLSGQIPLDPSTGALIEGSVEEQAHQVLRNIAAVLTHLGISFCDVVKTTIFLTDLAAFSVVNKVYEAHLDTSKPARSTIEVAALPLGAQVEIEMIAVCP